MATKYHVDYEYLGNVKIDFDSDFLAVKWRKMVSMVGFGGAQHIWCCRQFVAASETPKVEKATLMEFLQFLERAGALNPNGDAFLYYWLGAEIWQSTKAAEGQGLQRLAAFPWYDLQNRFHAGPIALPGCWSFGL